MSQLQSDVSFQECTEDRVSVLRQDLVRVNTRFFYCIVESDLKIMSNYNDAKQLLSQYEDVISFYDEIAEPWELPECKFQTIQWLVNTFDNDQGRHNAEQTQTQTQTLLQKDIKSNDISQENNMICTVDDCDTLGWQIGQPNLNLFGIPGVPLDVVWTTDFVSKWLDKCGSKYDHPLKAIQVFQRHVLPDDKTLAEQWPGFWVERLYHAFCLSNISNHNVKYIDAILSLIPNEHDPWAFNIGAYSPEFSEQNTIHTWNTSNTSNTSNASNASNTMNNLLLALSWYHVEASEEQNQIMFRCTKKIIDLSSCDTLQSTKVVENALFCVGGGTKDNFILGYLLQFRILDLNLNQQYVFQRLWGREICNVREYLLNKVDAQKSRPVENKCDSIIVMKQLIELYDVQVKTLLQLPSWILTVLPIEPIVLLIIGYARVPQTQPQTTQAIPLDQSEIPLDQSEITLDQSDNAINEHAGACRRKCNLWPCYFISHS